MDERVASAAEQVKKGLESHDSGARDRFLEFVRRFSSDSAREREAVFACIELSAAGDGAIISKCGATTLHPPSASARSSPPPKPTTCPSRSKQSKPNAAAKKKTAALTGKMVSGYEFRVD